VSPIEGKIDVFGPGDFSARPTLALTGLPL